MSNVVWIPAAIGAASALVVTLAKDFAFYRINRNYSKQRTEGELFQEYLNPILVSLEALFWRLDEILGDEGRGVYLRSDSSGSQYAKYKRASSVYRLCVTIGWFRAFDRELFNVRSVNRKEQDKLRVAFRKFQSSLADGKSVELEKYDKIVSLFELGDRLDQSKRVLVAIQIENTLDACLGDAKHQGLRNKPFTEQKQVVESILMLALEVERLPDDLMLTNEAIVAASEILSFRQTWIYRDWQAAIGDAMLRESSDARKYEVIGYGDFEKLWKEPPEWLTRVSALLLDFDVIQRDENDARYDQLEKIFKTVAGLIVSLLSSDQNLASAMPVTFEKARQLDQ